MNTYEVKEYGYERDVITCDHHVLGAVDTITEVIQEDGQWDETMVLLDQELQQRRGIETCNCTSFGTLNAGIEALQLKKWGRKENYSDRALGIAAGTFPPGNSPHKVAETIRKVGLVRERSLPFGEAIRSVEEYYKPSPLPEKLENEGKIWKEIYEFNHAWVFTEGMPQEEKEENIKKALRYSPLGVAVRAWQFDGEYFFKNRGESDTHWCVLYGYVEGQYWKVYDSYDQTFKKLRWDYYFERAKKYSLKALVEDPEYYEMHALSPKKNWFSALWHVVINLFKRS